MGIRRLLACASAFALSACSLIPEHTVPALPVAAAWPEPLVQAPALPEVAHGPAAEDAWNRMQTRMPLPPLTAESWRQWFTGSALQHAIATALENNRDLTLAMRRVDEARVYADAAKDGLWPSLDLVAQRSVQHSPANLHSSGSNGGGSGGTGGNGGNGNTSQRYDAALATAYELDFWGRVRSLDRAAQADYLSTQFAREALRLQLIGDVANAWYVVENWQQREQITARIEASRKTTLDLVTQRRNVGIASDLDVSSAQAAYHAARSDRFNATRQRVFADNALRLLLGSEITAEIRPPVLDGEQALTMPVFPAISLGLPSEVLLRRPDVRAAEAHLRAARADIGAARAAFLPRITLTATAGTASAALSGLFTAGSQAWSFVPVLRLPLFDAGRYQSELDLAKVREHRAVAEYEQTVQRAFRDVADALAARPFGWVVVSELYNAADALAARQRLVQARYDVGLINRLELLDAERERLNGELGRLAARVGIQNAAVVTFKSIGGI